ncbi:hypothetical protein SUGI_1161360 [Cryptomeria japonica]|uniref:uncharacterized protein LOC131073617 n=1 Tax=Cryptomeria japonica TaxID=3369 RepID=UPI002414B2D0|nr:uncharacterized protein LOC131073617 [Cryptomeria japonica]GLJ54183.1 hypothetical protein SUGI_1161360 [Cryptomeria japonica]
MAAALRCFRRFLTEDALTSASSSRVLWKPLIAERGLLARNWGIALQSCNFSSKGRKKNKSDSSQESGDEMSEKEAALEATLNQIAKDFGKETVMWLGRTSGRRQVPVISTGSVGLDIALGVGGLPKGRVVEIYGPEASGKTTLALHAVAQAQKSGGYCVFVDAEHSLDPTLAEAIGVDTKNLLLAQPDCGEQALCLVDTFIRSGSIDVIVVDSVAALVPKTELDGEVGDTHVALQARLMSQCLRKLTHALSCSQTLLIFINQVRAKLGGFGFGGPLEVTSGGNALKFYASVRLNIRRIGGVKKGEEMVGSNVQVKVVKNKLAPPFKTAEFEIEFGKGISSAAEVLDLGHKHGLIPKSGNHYSLNGVKFNGRDKAKAYLAENPDTCQELAENVKAKVLEDLRDKHDDLEKSLNASMEKAVSDTDVEDTEVTVVAEA